MAFPKNGYTLVADKRSLGETLGLAELTPAITAIKAHPKWLIGTQDGDHYGQLMAARGRLYVVAEQQVGLGTEGFFAYTMDQYARRFMPDAVTLSSGLSDSAIYEIARVRNRTYPGLALVVTAALPEMPEADFVKVGGIGEFTQSRFELARDIGNAMVYGAAQDIVGVDTLSVPFVAAGISRDGLPYNGKSRTTTAMRAHALGASLVLLGTVLGEDPAGFLHELDNSQNT